MPATQLLILCVAFLGVACVVAVAATPSLRAKIVGSGPVRNAALPLVAAGFAWVASMAGGLTKDLLKESTIPSDSIQVFVEDTAFSFPHVGGIYRERRLTTADLQKLSEPFESVDDVITLTADEYQLLWELESRSGMLPPVNPGQSIDVSNLFRSHLYQPAGLYFEYGRWSERLDRWSKHLVGALEEEAADPRDIMLEFTGRRGELGGYAESAGILRSIVGIAFRRELSLSSRPGECMHQKLEEIQLEESDEGGSLDFATYRIRLWGPAEPERRAAAARELARLLQGGCVGSLARIFRLASNRLGLEQNLMGDWVEKWNEILRARRSSKLRVRVTVSNLGRFDSFYRREARVVVGAKGDEGERLDFEAVAISEDRSPLVEPFVRVSSRSTDTRDFVVIFSDEEQLSERVHAIFQGQISYLRIGLLVSAGQDEDVVVSQVAPFSSDAVNASLEKIRSVDLTL